MRKVLCFLVLFLCLAVSAQAAEVIWASDLHYYAQSLCQDENILATLEINGDGRSVVQVAAITQAFLDQVLAQKPNALILSGDLTYNGELKGHQELRAMLEPLRQAGIAILVIPGNHDINTLGAYGYENDQNYKAEETSWEDFHALYDDLAFSHALLAAENSYSYLYPITEDCWVLMLDTVITQPATQSGGRFAAATREFAANALQLANDQGAAVITVSHHNLLQHSPSFYEGYVAENNEKTLATLQEGGVKLNLSGHMHIQHMAKENGFTEMLLSALPMTPCQYGVISYTRQRVDIHTETLEAFSEAQRQRYIKKMAARYLLRLSITHIPPEEQTLLADFGARINAEYFAGQVTSAFLEEPVYALFEKYADEVSTLARFLNMMDDMDRDLTRLSISE